MLTDAALRALKPSEKPRRVSDSGGLFIEIRPGGSKLWRLAYRFHGRQRLLALGSYPKTLLVDARAKRDAAKALLKDGRDPGHERKLEKIAEGIAANATFGAVADDYIERITKEGRAEATLTKTKWLLDFARDDFGSRPIAAIKAPEILATLRKIERRGRLETARRARSTIGSVFRFAIATARADSDPTQALAGALLTPRVVARPAITDRKALGALLRAIDGYEGAPEVVYCLRLLPLLACRPGELRLARWSEFDFDAATWTVPGERAKMRRAHVIPLAPQAVALLREIAALTNSGPEALVFPSIRSRQRPISENTINACLRRMGYASDAVCGHGFRATFSTLANESGRWRPDIVEAALGHLVADPVRAAYMRSRFLEERRDLMVWYADLLDALRTGAEIVPLRAS